MSHSINSFTVDSCCRTCGEQLTEDERAAKAHLCAHGGPMVDLGALSDEALDGINAIMAKHSFPTLRRLEPVSRVVLAVNVARNARDHASIFPKGKWATLQVMEAAIAGRTGDKPTHEITAARRDAADAATSFVIMSTILERGGFSDKDQQMIAHQVDESEQNLRKKVVALNDAQFQQWSQVRTAFAAIHGEEEASKMYGPKRDKATDLI